MPFIQKSDDGRHYCIRETRGKNSHVYALNESGHAFLRDLDLLGEGASIDNAMLQRLIEEKKVSRKRHKEKKPSTQLGAGSEGTADKNLKLCPHCEARVGEKRLAKHLRICPKRPRQAEARHGVRTPHPAHPRKGRTLGRPMAGPARREDFNSQRTHRTTKKYEHRVYSDEERAFREAQARFHEAQLRDSENDQERGRRG